MNASYAVITGASAGLGAEFARQLAAQGQGLVLVARRQERLAALAEELNQRHGTHVVNVVADLMDPEAPAQIARACREAGLRVDWLVNNAGTAGPDLLEERSWEDQQAFYQLMVLSVAQLCHLFVPEMVERGYGRVINVASVAARIPQPGGCNYGPAKAYLVALSEELNLTVASSGVHVSALCPGFTRTEFHDAAGLTEIQTRIPKWLWCDASTVVHDGLWAAESGRAVMVSGRLYRWLDPLFQSVFTRRFFQFAPPNG